MYVCLRDIANTANTTVVSVSKRRSGRSQARRDAPSPCCPESKQSVLSRPHIAERAGLHPLHLEFGGTSGKMPVPAHLPVSPAPPVGGCLHYPSWLMPSFITSCCWLASAYLNSSNRGRAGQTQDELHSPPLAGRRGEAEEAQLPTMHLSTYMCIRIRIIIWLFGKDFMESGTDEARWTNVGKDRHNTRPHGSLKWLSMDARMHPT
ncbi:hypothetical protein B0I35DRAFT_153550 [Stachybotrys elegans]|uniref:Uncharacterized protein n=1 Tax=Stachybotrys elegans TaxID=80388 RepID=A0A8K0SIJ4_9HYPO|nr:hypothetical protein B0I35DRAFT_153550 [Stachybotrys elegans]